MDEVNELASQYLTFTLGKELFGIGVEHVREVLDHTKITRIPGMPGFMSGIISVRGTVVPVINLEKKFDYRSLSKEEKGVENLEEAGTIIVLDLSYKKERIPLGILSETVEEVLKLEKESIEPPPKIGLEMENSFVKGIGKKDNLFVIILDPRELLEERELERLIAARPQ